MSKYIIRNCPSCTKQDECIAMYLRTSVGCKDRNDCVMKQIVKECVNSLRFSCERILAEKLLGLLDIQEVET